MEQSRGEETARRADVEQLTLLQLYQATNGTGGRERPPWNPMVAITRAQERRARYHLGGVGGEMLAKMRARTVVARAVDYEMRGHIGANDHTREGRGRVHSAGVALSSRRWC